MLAGLLLLEMLSIGLFAALLTEQQTHRVYVRAQYWLTYESASLATQVTEALEQQKPGWVSSSVKIAGNAPNIAVVKITDPAGNVLFINKGDSDEALLEPEERAQIPATDRNNTKLFTMPDGRWEGVRPIYTGGQLRGYVWVAFDNSAAREQLIRHSTGHARLRHHLDRGVRGAGAADGAFHRAAAGYFAARNAPVDELHRKTWETFLYQ